MTQNSSGIRLPVPINQGGTAAITASAALTSLGAVPLAGGTMSGLLILSGDPSAALGAATKQYVDTIASGLDFKDSCYAATTANLNAIYLNGAAGVGATLTNAGALAAFSVDGVSPPINSRILVKDQTTTFESGIYTLSTVGSGAVAWILTRSTDFDTPAEIPAGAWTIINNGTLNGTTSWVQTATVTTIGVDPITFSQFTAGVGANRALSNLITTSINTDLLPSGDALWDLGTGILRWRDAYLERIQTGNVAADTLQIGAYDVNGAAFTAFITLTANNTPTCALSGAVTGVTQILGTDDTTLATTEFVQDGLDDLSLDKANTTLNNLGSVAINTSLISDTDITDNLGSAAIRWDSVFCDNVSTGDTAGDVLTLSARDVDGATWVDFITLTANNTPTCALSSAVTGVTQAPNTNTTQLATCAYVDAATGGGSGANVALSNLAGVAINTTLVSDTDITDDLGTQAIRWRNIYAQTLQTGDTAADTLQIGAWDVDNTVFVPFFTLTANNTPTGVLSGSVTGTTQSALTSNTTLATTAYADASSAARANVALSNLSGVAINTTLVSDTDITDDLGSATVRWANTYTSTLRTGSTAATTLLLQARDVDGAAWTTFITLTAANTPTCAIAGATITGGSVSSLATDIAVADGGTGLSSATAYAVICGGTTSTNPLQSIASVGTAAQVLTSNGAGALPTFQAAAGGGGEGAKVWLNMNGAGTVINDSFNVTSVADTGTGKITITIATDFANATYVVNSTLTSNGAGAAVLLTSVLPATKAVGSVEVDSFNAGGSNADPVEGYNVVMHGDQ